MVAGDLNINLFNPNRFSYVDTFIATMLSLSFYPVITKPTRISETFQSNSVSLLDHIWLNFSDGQEQKSFIFHFMLTDHFPVCFLTRLVDRCNIVRKKIKFRNFNEVNITNFVSIIENFDFTSFFNFNDPGTAFNQFYSTLFNIYNAQFPIKQKSIKKNKIFSPWINKTLKHCIRKKYRLFNLLKRGLISRREFNIYKNTLNWVTKKIRKLYYVRKFNAHFGDKRRTWKEINTILGRGKKSELSYLLDGDLRVSGEELPNFFNNYFVTCVSDLIAHLPNQINFNYFNGIPSILNSCFLFPTSYAEVTDVVMKLKEKCDPLYDFKPSILKLILHKIVPVIVYIYNNCLSSGKYPSLLKMARVVPIFKSGSCFSVGNYRPITNILFFDKIFEKLTFTRVSSFAYNNDLISSFQYGFKPGSNTCFPVFNLVNNLLNNICDKKYSLVVFLDLRKAFDVVNKDILMLKLSRLGFRGLAYDFIKSYISDWKQFVTISGRKSDVKSVSFGVPQGSILAPILFNLFINDITNIDCDFRYLFADDAVFCVADKNFHNCIDKLRKLISDLSSWLMHNKLVANTSKTKIMLFKPSNYNVILPNIYFNNCLLEWVSDFKYLGVIIDNKLNFSLHLKYVNMNLNRILGMIYSLSSYVPRNVLMTIYNSLVLSTINYNIMIWGGAARTNTRPIQITLNKILRIILDVKFDENYLPVVRTNEMYKSLGLLKFNDLYRLSLLKFLHFVFYKDNEFFNRFYLPLLPRHNYNTRNVRIDLPIVGLDIQKRFAHFQSCQLLNEIDEELIVPQSNKSLIKKFKEIAINQYS